jgi:Cysteine-rich secretory protein family
MSSPKKPLLPVAAGPALFVVLLALLLAPAPAALAAPRPVELELLRLTNQYRVSLGLRPVLLSDRLQAEAEWYAGDMAAHDIADHDHIDSLGRDLWQRLAAFGYDDGGQAAQNWGVGSADARIIFEALRASPPHARTMREPTYRVTGVALAENPATERQYYWVMTFGQRDDRHTTVTLRVPSLPRLAVRGCHAATHCGARRPIVLVAPAGASVELRLRASNGVWSSVVERPRRVRIRLRAGERLQARARAPGHRGRWRTLRP